MPLHSLLCSLASLLLFLRLCSDKHVTRPNRCFSKETEKRTQEIMAAEEKTRVAQKKGKRMAKLALFMLSANAVCGPWRCQRLCPFALRLSSGRGPHALCSHTLITPTPLQALILAIVFLPKGTKMGAGGVMQTTDSQMVKATTPLSLGPHHTAQPPWLHAHLHQYF